jgi:hypothetical protein
MACHHEHLRHAYPCGGFPYGGEPTRLVLSGGPDLGTGPRSYLFHHRIRRRHVIPSDRGCLALLWDDDRKPRVVEMLAPASSRAEKSCVSSKVALREFHAASVQR